MAKRIWRVLCNGRVKRWKQRAHQNRYRYYQGPPRWFRHKYHIRERSLLKGALHRGDECGHFFVHPHAAHWDWW